MVTNERIERFSALYDSSRSRLIAYALRRAASADDAADAIAETFEITWRRLDAVPEGGAAVLWLYVTCRHVLANHRRSSQRHSDVLERLSKNIGAAFTLSSDPYDTDRLEAIAALTLLGEEDRELLMLAAWEGLDTQQLAYVLSCSPAAARVRLYQARRHLDELLDEMNVDSARKPQVPPDDRNGAPSLQRLHEGQSK